MRRALSLAAYLAYARSAVPPLPKTILPARPEGRVVLACADSRETARTLSNLGGRLRNLDPSVRFLLAGSGADSAGIPDIQLPPDTPLECDPFARSLRPEVVLWSGQTLQPALVESLKRSGSRIIALDVRDRPWDVAVPRWMPDPSQATLALFDSFYTSNGMASRRLRKLGVDQSRIRKEGPFLDTSPQQTPDDSLHQEVSTSLAARPVWMAANLHASEAGDVFRAHRQTSRLAHRLLLIAVPVNETEAQKIASVAEDQQLRICYWDQGDDLGEHSQILLTESPDELALWYRLAPLVFLGGSLANGIGGQDPYPAAASGSAILYGPNVGNFLSAYSKLASVGAARIIRDTDSLAAAVSQLIAPDQTATMAHAGWDLVSSGAELVDTVVTELITHLDQTGEP